MQEAWDKGLSPGLGRSPGEGHGNPCQYSCLENPMDRGAYQAIVMGLQSQTWLKRLSTKDGEAPLGTSVLLGRQTQVLKGQGYQNPKTVVWTQGFSSRTAASNWGTAATTNLCLGRKVAEKIETPLSYLPHGPPTGWSRRAREPFTVSAVSSPGDAGGGVGWGGRG